MGWPASHHAEAGGETDPEIDSGFIQGHAQLVHGSELVTTNLTGKIARDHFTGSAAGTVEGRQFEGGEVNLSNGAGSIQLELGTAFVVKVRKSSKQEVSMARVVVPPPENTLRTSA